MGAGDWVAAILMLVLFGPIIVYFAVALWLTMWLMLRDLWESRHD